MSDITQTPPRPGGWLTVALSLLVGGLLGVGGAHLLPQPHPEAAPTSAAPAARYHCPMHPTVTADAPGKCPICGMDLVLLEAGSAEHPSHEGQSPSAEGASAGGEREIVFYRSPMDPKITSPVPTRDEMGMDFIPVYRDELGAAGAGVEGLAAITIDPERQQLIGVRTAEVVEGQVRGALSTTGRVVVDPTRVRKVNVKVGAYVEAVEANFIGKPVRRGSPLFWMHSPELLAAQREYLLALGTPEGGTAGAGPGGEGLVEAAREHLRHWDFPEALIEEITRTRAPVRSIPVASPLSGVVTASSVVPGEALQPGDTPFEITDLSVVWLLIDVYEADLARVRPGLRARAIPTALPDQAWEGEIAFIDPMLDPATRTVKARVELKNPKGELRPEMFADVEIFTQQGSGLVIPFDAVIDDGRRRVVFVALEGGRFVPKQITLGRREAETVEVTSGLEAGERVVTRASFLLDSESRLKSALAALGGESP